jgi:two-component system OmpR family sensor kinase
MRALHVRLTLAVALVLLILGCGLFALIEYTSEGYAAELHQRLDAGIAMYVVRELPLLEGGKVNDRELKELANRAMTVNPSAEVYLLDPRGRVISTIVQHRHAVRTAVRLEPLQEFLRAPDRRPIYGDDPTSLDRERVFSVAPIMDQGRIAGYLYVVLGGQSERSIAERLWSSYVLRVAATTLALIIFMTLAVAGGLFFSLTRRLRSLDRTMREWAQSLPTSASYPSGDTDAEGDEISALTRRFHAMSSAIEAQIRELKTTDELRRELVANVSHDLRTPLTALRGYIETVLVKAPVLTGVELTSHLQVALRQANQVGRLIDALFELARLESGTVVPKIEHVSIAELLQDVAMRFRLLAETAGVDLKTRLDTSGVLVHADVALIERVIGNLLENAVRHTPRSGEVRLEMAVEPSMVRVRVADTGVGIEARHLPHIFNRIYRVREAADRNRAGLGLSIVKRIVELHSQQVRITSRKGIGTTVEFSLARVASSAAVPLATSA